MSGVGREKVASTVVRRKGPLKRQRNVLHGTCSPCLQNDTCTFKGIWGGSHVPDKVVLISSFWWTALGGGERSSSCRCAAVVLWLYFCMSRGSGRRGTACSIRIHTAGMLMVQTPRACFTLPSGLVPENATGVELTPRDYGALADLACNTPLESYAEVGPAAACAPLLGQHMQRSPAQAALLIRRWMLGTGIGALAGSVRQPSNRLLLLPADLPSPGRTLVPVLLPGRLVHAHRAHCGEGQRGLRFP